VPPDRRVPQHRRSSCRRPRPPGRPASGPYRALPADGGTQARACDNSVVSVAGSATSANRREPTCETNPAPSAVTVIFGRVVVTWTLEVPYRSGRTGPSASSILPGQEALFLSEVGQQPPRSCRARANGKRGSQCSCQPDATCSRRRAAIAEDPVADLIQGRARAVTAGSDG
jgi:hypothetical protein